MVVTGFFAQCSIIYLTGNSLKLCADDLQNYCVKFFMHRFHLTLTATFKFLHNNLLTLSLMCGSRVYLVTFSNNSSLPMCFN